MEINEIKSNENVAETLTYRVRHFWKAVDHTRHDVVWVPATPNKVMYNTSFASLRLHTKPSTCTWKVQTSEMGLT
jgi:hypothetical protein